MKAAAVAKAVANSPGAEAANPVAHAMYNNPGTRTVRVTNEIVESFEVQTDGYYRGIVHILSVIVVTCMVVYIGIKWPIVIRNMKLGMRRVIAYLYATNVADPDVEPEPEGDEEIDEDDHPPAPMPPPQQGPLPDAGSSSAAASSASSARRSYPVGNPEPQSEDSTRGPSRDGSGGRRSSAAAIGGDDQGDSGSSDMELIAVARRVMAESRAAEIRRAAAAADAARMAAAASSTPHPTPKRDARGSRRQEPRDHRSSTPPPRTGRHAVHSVPHYRPSDDRVREWIQSRPNDWQPPVADYNMYTVPQLSELCKERGLPCTGLKPDIIRRLMKCDNRVMHRPTHVGPDISRTHRSARRRDARR